MQTPATITLRGNPSWLHRLAPAPCIVQTPPRTACLVHPSWRQYFFLHFPPCLMQSPPCLTLLVHPSRLQFFTIAPCAIQTPPQYTHLAHPSYLQYKLLPDTHIWRIPRTCKFFPAASLLPDVLPSDLSPSSLYLAAMSHHHRRRHRYSRHRRRPYFPAVADGAVPCPRARNPDR